jgi:hypothetical protein
VSRSELQRTAAVVKPPLRFRLWLLAKRVFVCWPFRHRRVDIASYEPGFVIVHDCCRRCGKEWSVTRRPRLGPRPAHRHVVHRKAA